MLYEVEPVAFPLELRRNDFLCIDSSHSEGDQCRRHIDMLEGSAHRVLAADRRESELNLHLQGAEQGAHRLAPDLRTMCHSLEVFLA